MQKISAREKIGLVLFGVFLCVVFLELGMRAAGFTITFLQERKNLAAIRERGAYRILCLGESTTACGGLDSYPSQLEEILNHAGRGVKFSVINKGRPGTDTALIVSELQDNLNMYAPDVVVTMMGVNDHHVDNSVVDYSGSYPGKIARFFGSFRVYKLIQLLGSSVAHKTNAQKAYDASLPLFLGEHQIVLDMLSKKNPQAYQEYLEYKQCLLRQQGWGPVEAQVEKVRRLIPGNPWAYLGLGRCYWYANQRDKAAEMFGKAMATAPGNDWVYLMVGSWYANDTDDFDKAADAYGQAIKINPANPVAYVMLAYVYDEKKEYDRAKEMFEKAIGAGPRDAETYLLAGQYYWHAGDYTQAEGALRKAIELDPRDRRAYAHLGASYLAQKRYGESEEAIKKSLALTAHNDRLRGTLLGGLAQCYTAQGDYESAGRYSLQAERFRSDYWYPATVDSYQKLKDMVTARGIKLVCVQYPMRSVMPLKKMLGQAAGVFFVDNEKLFQDAVRQGAYADYFQDHFGGDFGHCTRKGNRLLAENIADTLLKNVCDR